MTFLGVPPPKAGSALLQATLWSVVPLCGFAFIGHRLPASFHSGRHLMSRLTQEQPYFLIVVLS
jgi:hypothetical protein